ncbi:MAG: carboxylesterase family protein [Scrofimicrobium sp.]
MEAKNNSSSNPVPNDEFVEVETSAGTVRGRWTTEETAGGEARWASFLGIPFAEPPVGDLRFMAPVPKAHWDGVRDALQYGASAQRGDSGITLIPEPSVPGESTLNVNVFTPSPKEADEGASLPVLVWIHGGGYAAGSPASPWYNGRAFNRDGVVTVTISYRLGFDGFGWMKGAPMNRGVLDWLLALEWVQQNVASFGGDPDRVTIAGQSAGGGAVLALLGMEKAQHLFSKVYSISGALADVTMTDAKDLGLRMAREAGIVPTRAAWSTLSEQRILEIQAKTSKLSFRQIRKFMDSGLGLGPAIDGEVITRPSTESIAAGVGADKPLLLGTTDDEFTMIFGEQEKLVRLVPKSLLLKLVGVPKDAQKAYTEDNADVAAKDNATFAGRAMTDRMFRAPTIALVKDRGSAPTWLYRFAWPSGKFGFAEHCLDVPFFFDCLDGPAVEPLAGDNPPQQLADEVHADAVCFVKDGDPGWPKYTERDPVAHVFDTPSYQENPGYASVRALL